MDKSVADAPPGERYIDIITRGCAHFGVDPAYIAKLKAHPVQPRKKPSEYRRVQVPPPVLISPETLAAGTGAPDAFDPSRPLIVSINGKVLRWVTMPENESQKMIYKCQCAGASARA